MTGARGSCVLAMLSLATISPAWAQAPSIKLGGSANIHKLSNIPLFGYFNSGGIEIEQELTRPFVYIPTWRERSGFVVIDISKPESARLLYTWRIENAEVRVIGRGETGKYFKSHGRYYYIKSTVFARGTLDSDLGAIVFDVTGLPDTTKVREVGRIRGPDIPDGFISVFPYKHSDGRPLLFGAVRNAAPGTEAHAKIYDLDRFLARDPTFGFVGKVGIPETPLKQVTYAYHDVYVAYDAATRQDKFYGGGAGGFYIYDVTKPETPRLLTSISGMSGVGRGHTIIASPDHRYAVTQMEYQFSPLMIFDLKPGLSGEVATMSRPIGSWIADWRDLSHNHDVRWPYVFAAAYEDGLQVVDVRNPADPKTVGWYYTCECPHQTGFDAEGKVHGEGVFSGAMELDVRNADGLIVVSDLNTGFWAFRMDGFNQWSGVSSAQDWDRAPGPAAR